LAPIITVAANAYIPEFQYDLAYDNTPHSGEHPFRQWFRQEPDPLLKPKRQDIDPQLSQELLNRILQHSEGARAHRACVQYQESLASWQLGGELRSVMHLWMAVEALTKAMLRVECQRQSVDEDGLCTAWVIEKKQLDGEVRRRLIFHGDSACYDKARKTSDGLEHMFEDFPKLHQSAQQSRDCAGHHVRMAMLELLGLDEPDKRKLLAPPYAVPVPLEVLDRSVYGDLIGPGDRLARPGLDHPQLVNWRPEIVSVTRKGDGHEVAIADNFQLAIGSDVQFKTKAVGTNVQLNSVDVQVTKAEQPSVAPDPAHEGRAPSPANDPSAPSE
jgi:hypothetical protein